MDEENIVGNLNKYRFANYQNLPKSIWHRLPVSRRAAVFILLFVGQFGEWRVVLTKRSSKLRNFPGHISLPGGKADSALETEWNVSRREMFEEIGIDSDNNVLKEKYGFTIDHLTMLPCFLSRTFSAVRPCVGILRLENGQDPLIERLNISLNPGESSSIFSCPLRDFLYPRDKTSPLEALEREYSAMKWGGIPWSLRSYTFLQENPNEPKWLASNLDLSASDSDSDRSVKRKRTETWGKLGSRKDEAGKVYDVWGLTANILHDLLQIAYKGNATNVIGEEELIYNLWNEGKLMRGKEKTEPEKKLIEAEFNDFGFNDILPRTVFNKLKELHKL